MQDHKLFEALYQETENRADDVAERIRQLGDFTPIMMGEFLKLKSIQDVPEVLKDHNAAVKHLLSVYLQIIEQIRTIMQDLGKDESTRNLLAGIIQGMEKEANFFLRSSQE